jgi:hypothetical protein
VKKPQEGMFIQRDDKPFGSLRLRGAARRLRTLRTGIEHEVVFGSPAGRMRKRRAKRVGGGGAPTPSRLNGTYPGEGARPKGRRFEDEESRFCFRSESVGRALRRLPTKIQSPCGFLGRTVESTEVAAEVVLADRQRRAPSFRIASSDNQTPRADRSWVQSSWLVRRSTARELSTLPAWIVCARRKASKSANDKDAIEPGMGSRRAPPCLRAERGRCAQTNTLKGKRNPMRGGCTHWARAGRDARVG